VANTKPYLFERRRSCFAVWNVNKNFFVQSNTTQVYLLGLIALTEMLHVSAVYKTREYKKRPVRFLLYLLYCICFCVDTTEYCQSIGQNM
jgi:hypothetical protein